MTPSPSATEPREPDGLRVRKIWLVGATTVVVTVLLTGVAWLAVKAPPRSRAAAQPSFLIHDLFDRAAGGEVARAAGEQALAHYNWIDRSAGLARIPIEQAIDAVVADPALIAGGAR